MTIRIRLPLLWAFLLGLITALTQTILLRELMIATGAFELVVAVALSFWLLFTGIGALLFRYLPFLRRPVAAPALMLLLTVVGGLQLFSIHPLAAHFGTISGAALSIPDMVTVALVVLAPGCLLGGIAFPAYVAAAAGPGNATAATYLAESGGMAAGALLFYLFIDLFSPVRYSWFFVRYAERYLPDILVFSSDGHYGRFDKTRHGGQQAYFWNGQAAGVAGDTRPTEEFVGLALTQHPDPRRIAFIGGLLSGTAAEAARRMPQARITIIESDPVLLESDPARSLGMNATLRTGEPTDIISTLPPQDIVIIDLPDPSSVMLARFFSREFFSVITERAGPDTVLVVGLSGGHGMLPPEVAALNHSVRKALLSVFRTVVLIPAARHLWVAADNGLPTAEPAIVAERMERRSLSGPWFNTALVYDIFEPMHRRLTADAIEQAPAEENRLLRPAAYFETVRHTARRLDRPLPGVIAALPRHPFLVGAVLSILLSLVLILLVRVNRPTLPPLRTGALFFTGGSAFLLQIALMTLLQARVGLIYHLIALFTLSCMFGISGGLALSRWRPLPARYPQGALALLAFGIAATATVDLGATAYVVLNFVGGTLLGLSLGNLVRNSGGEDQAGAGFYLADLVGAAFCGLFFGAILLPLYDLRLLLVITMLLATAGAGARELEERRLKEK